MKKLIGFLEDFFLLFGGACFCIAILGLVTEGLLIMSGFLEMRDPWGGWAILMLIAIWAWVFFGLSLAWGYFYKGKP